MTPDTPPPVDDTRPESIVVTGTQLTCGHHVSLAIHSAETGAFLYCELCDDKSGRRDAEQRERELTVDRDAQKARADKAEARIPFLEAAADAGVAQATEAISKWEAAEAKVASLEAEIDRLRARPSELLKPFGHATMPPIPDVDVIAMCTLAETMALFDKQRSAATTIISDLQSVMVAAAEEIHKHWDAHCDAEDYGPANLMYRLERGVSIEYGGYSPGAFEALRVRAEVAEGKVASLGQGLDELQTMIAANLKAMELKDKP